MVIEFDATAFDALTAEELRARGSLKWNAFPGTIGAWVAEMDLPLAPPIRAALHGAVEDGAFGYLAPELAERARRACRDWYARETGWEIAPDGVWLVPDVLVALRIALDHVAGVGSVAVVTTPAYMPFLTRPQEFGHDVVVAPARQGPDGEWLHDLDALDTALAEAARRSAVAGARALLVLCNPWNPVGRVLTRVELEAVEAVVARHDALVFSDEIHAPLRYDGAAHVPYASLDEVAARHTVTAVSASKTWNLPGLKCAQLIATGPEVQRALRAPGVFASVEAATIGVLANAVAYREGGAWLTGALDYLDGNRAAFAEEIAAIPGARHTPPEGTYLAWVDLREVVPPSGTELPEELGTFFRERAGVALTDGAACGAPGFVRFNLALPRPLLREAVRAMAAAIAAA